MKDPLAPQRELLSRNPLFAGLNRTQLNELLGASRIGDLPAGGFLFRAGETIREAHVLIYGTVQRSSTLAGEVKKVIELAQPPAVLALGELFGDSRYTSSAETLTPCVVVVLGVRRLRALVRQNQELGWRVIQALAERQCAVEFDVTGYHHNLTGTQRVLDYLIELAGEHPGPAGETTVTLTTSKKTIASRIGMAPETLSRSLRLLRESGVIVVEGRHVHIQNAALLNAEARDERRRISFRRRGSTARGTLSAAALVNLCGRQRLLSQQVAIAWGQVAFRIAPDKGRVKLRKLDAELARGLARLAGAGLPTELANPLAALTDIWPRYKQALFEAEPAAGNAAAVLALSEEFLEAADRLTARSEQVADQPGARYVNLAGRNRMLSQRIVKLFLFSQWGPTDRRLRARLDAGCREFERDLAGLRKQDALAPELAAQLDEVASQWSKFRTVLVPAPDHQPKERHAASVIAAGDRLLRHVDTAVKLFERRAA